MPDDADGASTGARRPAASPRAAGAGVNRVVGDGDGVARATTDGGGFGVDVGRFADGGGGTRATAGGVGDGVVRATTGGGVLDVDVGRFADGGGGTRATAGGVGDGVARATTGGGTACRGVGVTVVREPDGTGGRSMGGSVGVSMGRGVAFRGSCVDDVTLGAGVGLTGRVSGSVLRGAGDGGAGGCPRGEGDVDDRDGVGVARRSATWPTGCTGGVGGASSTTIAQTAR